MEERMAEPAEEVAQQPPVEENDESDGEEGGRMFAWVGNDNMEENEDDDDDDDDDEEEVEVDEQPLDTEASESFELDAPAERSGHIAVVYGNTMFVWGGYRVSTFFKKTNKQTARKPFYLPTHLLCRSLILFHFFLFKQEFSNPRILWLVSAEEWAVDVQHGVRRMVG